MKSTRNRTLKYWHYAESGGYSLDPKDSDSYLNFVLMYQIVGTLVRNGSDGNYESFLAQSWSLSSDRLLYTFYFKPNLLTSKGNPINAVEYSKVFHFLSKYLSNGEGGGLVQFDRIVGMEDFLKGKSSEIKGVSVNALENSITFRFYEPPDDLLIAFTEPYFGFYNLNDLSSSGLKSLDQLDSSGIFEIESITKDRRSIILARRDQFNSKSSLYQKIHLRLFSNFEFEGDPEDSVIYGFKDIKDAWRKEYSFTTSDPNMLGALVLSPLIQPFSDRKLRIEIKQALDLQSDYDKLSSPRAQNTKYFNFLSKPTPPKVLPENTTVEEEGSSNEKKTLDVAYFNLLTPEKDWINRNLEKASRKLPFKLQLKQVDRTQPGEFAAVNSDQKYASRFVTVVVGGTASNQNNKMMFCSNLGVSFKDPSGRICELINNYELNGGAIDQRYVDEFSKILSEDAVVIPMMHLGFLWLHDKNIDADILRSGLGMPRLDLVERK